jgi:hypothetical protein
MLDHKLSRNVLGSSADHDLPKKHCPLFIYDDSVCVLQTQVQSCISHGQREIKPYCNLHLVDIRSKRSENFIIRYLLYVNTVVPTTIFIHRNKNITRIKFL